MLLVILAPAQSLDVDERLEVDIAAEDVPVEPERRLLQAVRHLLVGGDAEDAVELFQRELFGFGEEEEDWVGRVSLAGLDDDVSLFVVEDVPRHHRMAHQAAYQPKAPWGLNASTKGGQLKDRMKLKPHRTAVADAMPTSRT